MTASTLLRLQLRVAALLAQPTELNPWLLLLLPPAPPGYSADGSSCEPAQGFPTPLPLLPPRPRVLDARPHSQLYPLYFEATKGPRRGWFRLQLLRVLPTLTGAAVAVMPRLLHSLPRLLLPVPIESSSSGSSEDGPAIVSPKGPRRELVRLLPMSTGDGAGAVPHLLHLMPIRLSSDGPAVASSERPAGAVKRSLALLQRLLPLPVLVVPDGRGSTADYLDQRLVERLAMMQRLCLLQVLLLLLRRLPIFAGVGKAVGLNLRP